MDCWGYRLDWNGLRITEWAAYSRSFAVKAGKDTWQFLAGGWGQGRVLGFFLMIGGITAYSRADGNDQIERDSTDDGQRVGARGLP